MNINFVTKLWHLLESTLLNSIEYVGKVNKKKLHY